MSVLPTEPSSAASPSPGEVPRLRLLPAPASEPPYDDEVGAVLQLVPTPAAARPLAPLPAPVPVPEPARPAEPAGLHVVPDLDDDEPDRPRLTPTAALPASRPFAHALVQRLLEVLAGVRPVTQLRRDTTVELYELLEQRVHARPRTTGPRPTGRAVRSVHVQARPEGVAEVCATVQRGPRMAALALRLEGRDGAWCCTELLGL